MLHQTAIPATQKHGNAMMLMLPPINVQDWFLLDLWWLTEYNSIAFRFLALYRLLLTVGMRCALGSWMAALPALSQTNRTNAKKLLEAQVVLNLALLDLFGFLQQCHVPHKVARMISDVLQLPPTSFTATVTVPSTSELPVCTVAPR